MTSASSVHAARSSRRTFLALLGGILCAAAAPASTAKVGRPREPLRVVATFSILGDMVREIGGDRIALTTIVGPNVDAHSFEPSPKDVKAFAGAQVLVSNGLGFEGWLPRLVESSGFKGVPVVASAGVTLRHLSADDVRAAGDAPETHEAHGGNGAPHTGHDATEAGHDHAEGDVDPHAWQDLANGMVYAQNIADGLAQADPGNRVYYKNRAKAYTDTMKKLDTEIRNALESIPAGKRNVLTSHDSFGYFSRAYGIRFISVAGLSTEAEASARDVAAIIDRARKENISAVFFENSTNPKLVEQIARESGARVGGTLYADALAPPDQPAATYLGMFSWNAGRLIYVLKK